VAPPTYGYDPETLSIGVLGRPHGVAGELLLRPHNRGGTFLEDVDRVTVVKNGRTLTLEIEALRRVADGYLVRFAGVQGRDAAAALTLGDVRVPRTSLPPLAPGEYYIEDVPGCAVDNEEGQALGVVRGVFWNGAHDVATVEGADRERLIPLVPDYVLSVDTAARRMTVRWEDLDE
jgi:16S rRNA processing protein RimM